jgi:chromosome segregation ATPase
MSNAAAESKIDEMCDDVFRLEGFVADRDTEIGRLIREGAKLTLAAQDASKELQVARDVVAIRDDRIATLEAQLEVARGEIVSQSKDLARKHETIAGQLTRIEELDNQLQNKLVDISALEDSISDRNTVRRSVKFNAVHMLQSALAVLNGL